MNGNLTGGYRSAWYPDGYKSDTTEHVCGNCRNPFTRAGRADCPNNTKGAS